MATLPGQRGGPYILREDHTFAAAKAVCIRENGAYSEPFAACHNILNASGQFMSTAMVSSLDNAEIKPQIRGVAKRMRDAGICLREVIVFSDRCCDATSLYRECFEEPNLNPAKLDHFHAMDRLRRTLVSDNHPGSRLFMSDLRGALKQVLHEDLNNLVQAKVGGEVTYTDALSSISKEEMTKHCRFKV